MGLGGWRDANLTSKSTTAQNIGAKYGSRGTGAKLTSNINYNKKSIFFVTTVNMLFLLPNAFFPVSKALDNQAIVNDISAVLDLNYGQSFRTLLEVIKVQVSS